MSQYADRISSLLLFTELKRSAGRDGISAPEVEQLVGVVNRVAEAAGPLLDQIPQTFRQYTRHDLEHSRNLIDLMGRFIPTETRMQLNALELATLVLSALLHDVGMFVTELEKEEVLASPRFRYFMAAQGDRAAALEEAEMSNQALKAEAIRHSLLAEYFRRVHPQRARKVLEENFPRELLVHRDLDLTDTVMRICESHGWGVLESNDPRSPRRAVRWLETEEFFADAAVNEQYLACCLRLADIMDFDRSRTPVAVFRHLAFADSRSWAEWSKHLAVHGWRITEYEVVFATRCTHPAFYVAVMEFLDWIDAELRDCRHLLVRYAPERISRKYKFHLPAAVERWKVEMKDPEYLAGGFRFQLDYTRIIQLLMDRSLYPDPSLFLRELLQNALDACRLRQGVAEAVGARYQPRIDVWDHSDDPADPRVVFQDNGIGMSLRVVENYFMRVGRSYYRSAEFDAERQRLREMGVSLEATSQFGIGILSCFMIADRFEVETYRSGNAPLQIAIEGADKYFVIRQLPEPARVDFEPDPARATAGEPPQQPGTRITVHLRSPGDLRCHAALTQFAVNVEYDVRVHSGRNSTIRVVEAHTWSRISPMEAGLPALMDEDRGGRIVMEDLREILVPEVVPLREFEFTRHLRGIAWYWLLRSEDGTGCIARGNLQIRGARISCVGLPVRVTEALRSINSEVLLAKRPEILNTLSAHLDSDRRHPFPELDMHGFAALSDLWAHLAHAERLAVIDTVRRTWSGSFPWYAKRGVGPGLLRGGLDWSREPAGFDVPLTLGRRPQSFALYGIHLPAGLVKWDPVYGRSRGLEFLGVPGGLMLDIRGANPPTPSANRLFVDVAEAGKVVVPVARAMLRHAHALAARGGNGQHAAEWTLWINEIRNTIEALPCGDEVLALERGISPGS